MTQINLKHLKLRARQTGKIYKPVYFKLGSKRDREKLDRICKNNRLLRIIDEWETQEREFYILQHPEVLITKGKIHLRRLFVDHERQGVWVYYPWYQALVHCLEEDRFNLVRLSRNQNIISSKEQQKLFGATLAIAGLNVGNAGAACLALEGIGSFFKLADNDILTLSNLNRFRAKLIDLGVNKAILSARQIYEINPFARVKVYDRGLSSRNITSFLLNPKPDILIEEMDNLKLKIKIRESARQLRIPVIMVTGNGEDVILDVERFDQKPQPSLLNNLISVQVLKQIEKLGSHYDYLKKIRLARDFIGTSFLNSRLIDSFDQVGQTLAGIPQLSEVSFLRGALLGFVTRKVILQEEMPSGRYFFKLRDIIK